MKHFSSSDLNPSPSSFRSVIFGEPTGLALVAGHKGTFGFKILAKGRPAHSGYPWLGASAISAILPVLQDIDGLDDIPPEEGGLPVSELLGRSTLNIGVLNGGVAGNVVPGFAEAGVKVRVAGGELEDIERIIERAVEKATRSSRSRTDVVGNGNGADVSIQFEGGSLPEFFDTDVTGFEVISVNYGTDAFSLHVGDRENGEKVKRYLYGPGSIYVAHGDDEGLTVGELEEAVRGYKRLIEASL